MNKTYIIAGSVGAVLLLGIGAYAYHSNFNEKNFSHQMQDGYKNTPIQTSVALSEIEKQDLLFLREEEKLAGDVYVALEKIWGQNTFANIQKAETTHSSQTLQVLTAYGIADPVGTNAEGVFTNPDLQALYTSLVEKGKVSAVDALQVGAYIEEYDIADIEKKLQNTTNPALISVYTQLMKGSENHLRAFTKNLAKQNVTYVPTVLSAERYANIIAAENEKGKKGGNKQGQGERGKRSE